jgi:hypothetical protein
MIVVHKSRRLGLAAALLAAGLAPPLYPGALRAARPAPPKTRNPKRLAQKRQRQARRIMRRSKA